ncbi:hypothetical protein R1CP_33535 [Rhodococcus opacus]|uniref:Uncharacterized protein n=1 Tax=Rhodococcus opacus TaxID=37919 RepID=A0A1B1KFE1_RHOOP|nr:hypothetical protein R1CP_33535 [Rhodococcus opacus]
MTRLRHHVRLFRALAGAWPSSVNRATHLLEQQEIHTETGAAAVPVQQKRVLSAEKEVEVQGGSPLSEDIVNTGS